MGKTTRANEYVLSKRDLASPYIKSFSESRAVSTPAVHHAPPSISPYFENEPEEVVEETKVKKVKKEKVKRRRTKGKVKRARRGFMVFLVVLFTLLYVAVGALSYLQLDMLEDYNSYFNLFEKVEDVTPEVAEGEEEPEKELIITAIGVEDIVMSFVKYFMPDSVEGDYIFYNECLATLEGAEMLDMVIAYALPVVLVLGLLIAVIFFIRAFVSLCTPKRRKLFVLSAILMLVLSVIGIACGFLWSGAEMADVMSFVMPTGALTMQVGYGYLIMTVLSLLTLVASLFAFRSKKKVQ